MEVIGQGSVTILDRLSIQTDAYEVKRHRPIMVSGVIAALAAVRAIASTCASASSGAAAPGAPTDRELASLAGRDEPRRLIRRIAAEGADDTAPERARRRRALSARRVDEEASE